MHTYFIGGDYYVPPQVLKMRVRPRKTTPIPNLYRNHEYTAPLLPTDGVTGTSCNSPNRRSVVSKTSFPLSRRPHTAVPPLNIPSPEHNRNPNSNHQQRPNSANPSFIRRQSNPLPSTPQPKRPVTAHSNPAKQRRVFVPQKSPRWQPLLLVNGSPSFSNSNHFSESFRHGEDTDNKEKGIKKGYSP
ncbi:hypothetical protein P9112_003864 [Eukaryota sp. TZLM1-RC]